jgi:hypothetical protein
MNTIPFRTLVAAAMVLLVLSVANFWFWPDSSLQRSTTSFGTAANGYKAAFDLANELGFRPTRLYTRPGRYTDGVLWLIAPSFLDSDADAAKKNADELLDWVRRGGTAIVLGGPGGDWKRLGLEVDVASASTHAAVTGDLMPTGRRISAPSLLHFASIGENTRVRLRSDGEPFALERTVDKGRLIAVADHRFLINQNLADTDNSLILVDLIRAFGSPIFDERCHGILTRASLIATVGDSLALLPIILGGVLGLLWIWTQHTWPRRRIDDDTAATNPSIAAFVDSLGILYSRGSDPVAAFVAYRSGFLRRLRHRSSSLGELNEEQLCDRIEHNQVLSAETRRWLISGALPKTEAELLCAVRALESCPPIKHG